MGKPIDPFKETFSFRRGSWKFLQFTGLHDKNGKEIYEGDLVKHPLRFGKRQECTAQVSFEDGAFVGNSIEQHEIQGKGKRWITINLANDDVEVIGNIYENPELLAV